MRGYSRSCRDASGTQPARLRPAGASEGQVVLLRHRLLPQYHGVEGLGLLRVVVDADNLARAQGTQQSDGKAHRRATQPAATGEPRGNDDVLAGADHLLRLEVDVFEVVREGFEVLAYAFMALVRLRVHERARGGPHDLGVEKVVRRLATVEGIDQSAHDLDVLLRHRPPSIPPLPSPGLVTAK